MYRTALIYASLLMMVSGCRQKNTAARLPFYNTADFTPVFLQNGEDPATKINHAIGPFVFTNQWGQKINREDLNGKIHVANFFFTGCGSICPGMMQKIRKLAGLYKQQEHVLFLSYTVTPWRDSVGKLRDYAADNRFNFSNWHLLTGPKSEIYTLARKSYFAEESLGFSKDSSDFLHTEHVLLIDKTGRIRGIYNGTLALDMEQLSGDIQLLMNENNSIKDLLHGRRQGILNNLLSAKHKPCKCKKEKNC